MNEISTDYFCKKAIILLEDVDRLTLEALEYARSISVEIIAFSAVINEEEETELRSKWSYMNDEIPYIIKHSLYKSPGELLLEYINSPEYDKGHDEVIVIVPLVIMNSLLQKYLNRSYLKRLNRSLCNQDNIVLVKVPYYLDSI